MLRLFRSATARSNSPAGVWLPMGVTNEFDPVTHQFIGTVSRLEASPGTSFVCTQVVFYQPALAAGSVVFDDLELRAEGAAFAFVPVSATLVGNDVALDFETLLGPTYQVQTTTNLASPLWGVLTSEAGSGLRKKVWVEPELVARFFRVVRPARRLVARVAVAASWLDWWRNWEARWWRAGAAAWAAPSG